MAKQFFENTTKSPKTFYGVTLMPGEGKYIDAPDPAPAPQKVAAGVVTVLSSQLASLAYQGSGVVVLVQDSPGGATLLATWDGTKYAAPVSGGGDDRLTATSSLRGIAHRGGFPNGTLNGQWLGVSIIPCDKTSVGPRPVFIGAYSYQETAYRNGTFQGKAEIPAYSGNWYNLTFGGALSGSFSQAGSTPDASNGYFVLIADAIPVPLTDITPIRFAISANGGVVSMLTPDGDLEGCQTVEFDMSSNSANAAALQVQSITQNQLNKILEAVGKDGSGQAPKVCTNASWAGGTLTVTLPSHGISSGTGNMVILEGFTNAGTAIDGVYAFSTSGSDNITIAIASDPGAISAFGVARVAQLITSAVWGSGQIVFTRTGHGFIEGDTVRIRGTAPTSVIGDYPIVAADANTYTVDFPTTPGAITVSSAYALKKYIRPSSVHHLRPFTVLGESNIACLALCGDSTTQSVDAIQDSTLLAGVTQRCVGEKFPFIDLSANNEGINNWLANPGTKAIREYLMSFCQGIVFGYSKNDENAYATIGDWTAAHDAWWARPAMAALASSKFNMAILAPSRNTTSRDEFTTVDGQKGSLTANVLKFHAFLKSKYGVIYQRYFDYIGVISPKNQPLLYKVDPAIPITFTTTAGSAAVTVDAATPLSPAYDGMRVLLRGAGTSGANQFALLRYISPTKFVATYAAGGTRVPLPLATAVTSGSGTLGVRKYISPSASQTDSLHESYGAIAAIRDTIALKP